MVKFRECHNLIKVSERAKEGFVIAGGQAQIKLWQLEQKPKEVQEARSDSKPFALDFQFELSELNILSMLAHNRLLNKPLVLVDLNDNFVTQMEATYDIAFIKNPDGTHTLLT